MTESNIAQFYAGRSLFITGATGFMGKVLIEKLLRSCPGIDRLYLLMRPSKGKDVACRLKELINNQVFDGLKYDRPNVLTKMIPIAGDVTSPSFGLSAGDLKLLVDNVSVVFNLAATVRFDEELKAAVEMNVNGPRELVKICRQLKKLKALVHVSTAFNNLDRDKIEEVIYPGSYDPITLIDFINSADQEFVQSITSQIVGKSPNTYSLTKALAEQILEKERGSLPLVIVRPSIVTGSLKEPYPGWIDNLNGPSGIIAAGGKGFIRVFKRHAPNYVTDLIPVDFSINLMITAAWHTSFQLPSKNVPIYSSSTSQRNPITFGQFEDFTRDAWMKYPTVEMLWYPSATCTNLSWYYQLNIFLWHLLPAYMIDFLFRTLAGKRRKWVSLYQRAFRAISSFDYFFKRQWLFVGENSVQLWDTLSETDRKLFYFDVKAINWSAYFEIYVLGVRQFILKDDLSTLPKAQSNLKKLYWFKMMLRTISYLLMLLSFRYVLRFLSGN